MTPERRAPFLSRCLVRLYPAWFRHQQGQQLEDALNLALDWHRGRGVRLLGSLIVGAVADALRLHLQAVPRQYQSTKRKPDMSFFTRDVRFATRSLLQRPTYWIIGALTLGLGIGANSLIFSVVESTLLRPLPYQEAERVMTIWSDWEGSSQTWVSEAEYAAYRDEIRSLQKVGVFGQFQLTLEHGETPERLAAAAVTRGLLDVLGLAPALGRGFTEAEAQEGASVVLLSHEIWQRRFAADPKILGSSIRLNGSSAQVVGVLPPGLVLPQDLAENRRSEIWTPMPDPEPRTELPQNGGSHGLHGIARLAPTATVASARAELLAFNELMTAEGVYAQERGFRTLLIPADEVVAGTLRPALRLLAGAVGLVLLLACANLANLCFTQALRRRRELAVRSALGAGATQLARLLLTEAVLIAITGGVLGLGLAVGGLKILKGLASTQIPRLADASLNAPVLLFTAAVTGAAALAFGLLPALWASRRHRDLRAGVSLPKRQHWTRTIAVATQVALAVVLLTGTGLMLRTVHHLLTEDAGFDRHGVITFGLYLPQATYPTTDDVTRFYGTAEKRIEALPGVAAAGAVRLLPLATTMGDYGVVVEGYQPKPGEQPAADWQAASPGYFEALGVPILQGRSFTDQDHGEAPAVMIVNESFVQRFLAGREPLGHRVRIGGSEDSSRPWTRIVGVVADISHEGLKEEAKPCWYLPHEQFHLSTRFASRGMSFAVRSQLSQGVSAAALMPQVRQTLLEMDPRLALSEVATMGEVVGASLAPSRLATALLLAFSLVALALATVGIYGVTSALVAQRRQELGIRLSLGALPRQAMALILGQGASAIALGVVAGLGGAMLASRLLASLLHGVTSHDPLTFLAAPFLIAAAGLLACYLPARRAARVDPRTVLADS